MLLVLLGLDLYHFIMRWPNLSASGVFAILMLASFLGLFTPPGCMNGFRAVVNSLITPPSVGANRLLSHFYTSRQSVPTLDIEQAKELLERLRQLERQNRFLHTQWMDMTDRCAQAVRLRKELLLENYSLVPANVYGQGLPGQGVLMIDQGKLAGLEKGFWVVAVGPIGEELSGRAMLESSVLVGRVCRVHPRTAEVRLLNDPNENSAIRPISARLYKRPAGADTELPSKGTILGVEALPGGGLVAKDIPKKSISLDEELSDVIGAVIISSSMKDLPAGLAIGQVVKVSSPTHMDFCTLTIEPLANSCDLSTVMVLRPLHPED